MTGERTGRMDTRTTMDGTSIRCACKQVHLYWISADKAVRVRRTQTPSIHRTSPAVHWNLGPTRSTGLGWTVLLARIAQQQVSGERKRHPSAQPDPPGLVGRAGGRQSAIAFGARGEDNSTRRRGGDLLLGRPSPAEARLVSDLHFPFSSSLYTLSPSGSLLSRSTASTNPHLVWGRPRILQRRLWRTQRGLPTKAQMAPKTPPRLHADLFDVTHRIVVDEIRANLPNQTAYDHVKIIRLNCEPTDEELARFYAEIHNHLLEVASASIDKNVDFFEPEEGFADNFDPEIEDDVPVLRPQTKNLSFFVVELVGRPGEPRLQFAIRHDNLYCCGFRVLSDADDAKTKAWFSFGPIELMKCAVFPNVKVSGLKERYSDLPAVKIYPEVFRRIYTYFSQFNANSKNKTVGELLKDTFFVIVCEASRFGFVQRLTFRGIHAYLIHVGLTSLMVTIIRDFHDLSVGTLLIWLFELEEKLSVDERARYNTAGQLGAALLKFHSYAQHVNLRGPDGHYQLEMVAGKGLYALMFDSEIVRLIRMRLRNYDRNIPKLTHVSY